MRSMRKKRKETSLLMSLQQQGFDFLPVTCLFSLLSHAPHCGTLAQRGADIRAIYDLEGTRVAQKRIFSNARVSVALTSPTVMPSCRLTSVYGSGISSMLDARVCPSW